MENHAVYVDVLSDGKRTVAQAAYFNVDRLPARVTATASAAVDPSDKPLPGVGEDLALARALRNLAAKIERQANGEVKHAGDCREHARQIAVKTGRQAHGKPWAWLSRPPYDGG